MKTLNQLEVQQVSGGLSFDSIYSAVTTGIIPSDFHDIEGVPHVDYRVAHGVVGVAPSVMVPASEIDYSLTATAGRIIDKLNPHNLANRIASCI